MGSEMCIRDRERTSHRFDISAQGTVIPAKEIQMSPEVTGRIVRLNDQMVPGGLISSGEVVFKIEPVDANIAVAESQTDVERARASLALEQGQQMIAQKEWAIFKDTAGQNADASLALREPQLKQAEVALEAAEARLRRARLTRARTTLKAPFNAMVQNENLEKGQLVTPQGNVATLVGTDAFWIQVSVPIDNLAMIDLPNANAEGGALATVTQKIGGQEVTREGRVVRLLPSLDPAGQMARLLVEIDDPLDLKKPEAERRVPLLLSSLVSVSIKGRGADNLVELSRQFVRDGNQVYVYADGKLTIRELQIVWRKADTVLVKTGVDTGDKVVTTRISAPLEGMKLRVAGDKRAPAKEADAPQAGGDNG